MLTIEFKIHFTDEPERNPFEGACHFVSSGGQDSMIDPQGLALREKGQAVVRSVKGSEAFDRGRFFCRQPDAGHEGDHAAGDDGRNGSC